MFRQDEYDVSKQQHRELHAKINLLNFQFQVVDEFSGVVVGNPTFSNDGKSDIRRTCSISIIPIDSSFNIDSGNKIWLDKYLQIFIGIKNDYTGEIIYTNKGIYMITEPNRVYDATNNTMTIQGIDLMGKLTGIRNGNLDGMDYIIPSGSNVRQVMIDTLKLAGFTKFAIEECPIDVPNDLSISGTSTVYNILSMLRDILPNYQIYFDVDGVFCYNKIPTGDNEPVIADDDLWSRVLLSYSVSTSFNNVKNSIKVYGKTHDIKNFGEATVSGNNYVVNIASIPSTLEDGTFIGFTAPHRLNGTVGLTLNSFPNKQIVDENGNQALFYWDDNQYYVVKYVQSMDKYQLLGTVTPIGVSQEDNPDSPFFVGFNYDSSSSVSGNTLTLSIEGVTFFEQLYNRLIKVTISSDVTINNVNILGKTVPCNMNLKGGVNVVKFNGYTFSFISTKVGTLSPINVVLSGGEYDNIQWNYLAQQRANKERYDRCRTLDTITLTCIPVYWLDVNSLVDITLPNKNNVETKQRYIVKSISEDSSITGTQSITMMKYYPQYSGV